MDARTSIGWKLMSASDGLSDFHGCTFTLQSIETFPTFLTIKSRPNTKVTANTHIPRSPQSPSVCKSLGTGPIRGFVFCASSPIFIHLSLSPSAYQPATCLLPIPPSTRATRSTRLSSSFRVKTDAATILNRRHQCIENVLHRILHICKPEFMVGKALLQLF